MNARFVVCAAVWLMVLAISHSAGVAAETYDIDTRHTAIIFSVSHNETSFTYGFFRHSQGRYLLDQTNSANSRFQLTIDTDSLDTNDAERDTHLKTPDFFNAKQFPKITFDSTSVAQSNTNEGVVYQVTGNLTMHGETRRITVPLQMLAAAPGLTGEYRTGFMAQFNLKRSDFGMTNLPKIVGDVVSVTISFEGVRQEPPSRQ